MRFPSNNGRYSDNLLLFSYFVADTLDSEEWDSMLTRGLDGANENCFCFAYRINQPWAGYADSTPRKMQTN